MQTQAEDPLKRINLSDGTESVGSNGLEHKSKPTLKCSCLVTVCNLSQLTLVYGDNMVTTPHYSKSYLSNSTVKKGIGEFLQRHFIRNDA